MSNETIIQIPDEIAAWWRNGYDWRVLSVTISDGQPKVAVVTRVRWDRRVRRRVESTGLHPLAELPQVIVRYIDDNLSADPSAGELP